jgi:hypothetical protein
VRTSTASTTADRLLVLLLLSLAVSTCWLCCSRIGPISNSKTIESNKTPLRYALEFEDVTGDCLAVMLINAGASLDSVVDWSCAGSRQGASRQFKRCSIAVSL